MYIDYWLFSVELSPGPEVSQKRKKFYSGPVVAQVLQHHHHALVKEIDPNEVAICLFRLGIIDDDEIESATNKHNSRRNRSNDLLLCLIRKLRSNPVWGNDAVVALKRAGVNMKSIATELEGTIQYHYYYRTIIMMSYQSPHLELSTESAAVTDAKKNTATTTSEFHL